MTEAKTGTTEPKAKARCSYPAELRKEAKAEAKGLITISVTLPNGERDEMQMAADAEECRYARWAASALDRRVRPLPDLESPVRQAVEDS